MNKSVAIALLLCAFVAGCFAQACSSDLQVAASYTNTNVYPTTNTVTFTIKDTTGNPGSGINNLKATTSFTGSGCNFAYASNDCGGTWDAATTTLSIPAPKFGVSSPTSTANTQCTLTFNQPAPTTTTCNAKITITSDCTNSLANSDTAAVTPRYYRGVPMPNDMYVYFTSKIAWDIQNGDPGETWSIYLQRKKPDGTWGSFRSSKYPVVGGNRNVLVNALPAGTKEYIWKEICCLLPGRDQLYRVIIESSTGGRVYFANGEDQYTIGIKPLKLNP